jgi:hypothetical protein
MPEVSGFAKKHLELQAIRGDDYDFWLDANLD